MPTVLSHSGDAGKGRQDSMLQIGCLLSAQVGLRKQILVGGDTTLEQVSLLGSTVRASVPSSNRMMTSFTLYPVEGENGLVAIRVYSKKNEHNKLGDVFCLFLSINWEAVGGGESSPRIDLKSEFIPLHPVSIDGGTILAQVGNQWVSSCEKGGQDTLYVPDVDLLCRYAFGTATEEEVLGAVVPRESEKKEISQLALMTVELEEAKKVVRSLQFMLDSAKTELRLAGERERELMGFSHLLLGELWPFCRKNRVASRIDEVLNKKS